MERTLTALVVQVTCRFEEAISTADMDLHAATCNKELIRLIND